jgi:F420H(2)-dependent quinone reductase
MLLNRVRCPALRGSPLGAILQLLNPVLRVVLRSPLHWPLSRWFAVLAWTGRKSGRAYSTPVSYVHEDNTAYVTTGDRWWRNLAGGAPVTMAIGGRWRQGVGQPITDRAESATLHERLFREHAWFRRLSGIPAHDGFPDVAALDRALAAGRTLVRIELA